MDPQVEAQRGGAGLLQAENREGEEVGVKEFCSPKTGQCQPKVPEFFRVSEPFLTSPKSLNCSLLCSLCAPKPHIDPLGRVSRGVSYSS